MHTTEGFDINIIIIIIITFVGGRGCDPGKVSLETSRSCNEKR